MRGEGSRAGGAKKQLRCGVVEERAKGRLYTDLVRRGRDDGERGVVADGGEHGRIDGNDGG